MDGVELVIHDDVLDYVVDKAIEFKLGARGLRSIFETIMIDVMYNEPSKHTKKFELTRDYAQQQLQKSNFELISSAK